MYFKVEIKCRGAVKRHVTFGRTKKNDADEQLCVVLHSTLMFHYIHISDML